jgi:hypothetical protein
VILAQKLAQSVVEKRSPNFFRFPKKIVLTLSVTDGQNPTRAKLARRLQRSTLPSFRTINRERKARSNKLRDCGKQS